MSRKGAYKQEMTKGLLELKDWGKWWHNPRPGGRLVTVGTLLLPLAAAALVYYRFLNQWFVTDDFLWLKAASNPDLPGFLRGAFAFPRGPTPYWRPLIDGYFFGMYRVFSLNAPAYHVANLLWHGAVAAGTVLIVKRVSRSLSAGLLAGLLFSVTPSYEATISWVSAATELISVFFSVATVFLFLRSLEGEGKRSSLLLATCTFAAALLAKETSVVLPAILAVLGLVVRPPKDRAEATRFALSLLPFAVMDAAYIAVQFSQVLVDPATTNYRINWDAVGRLRDRMLWLSWPLPSWYASWANAAQWAALLSFVAAASIALLRRYWVLPALFCCTVFALLPSSFLTHTFAPRWVYLASVPWAGFEAVLLMVLVGWISRRNTAVASATLALLLAGLGWVFIPRTIDAQRWMPPQSAQMQAISRAVQTECPALGPGRKAFVFPLPVVDPGNSVSSLIQLLRPGTSVTTVSGAAMEPPAKGDCLIDWDLSRYAVTEVRGDYGAGPYWRRAVAAPCPEALPWQQAGLYPGQLVTVRGRVVAVYRDAGGRSMRLDIGQTGGFAVLIQSRDPASFPVPPVKSYSGKTVCVRGVIHFAYGVLPIISLKAVDSIAAE